MKMKLSKIVDKVKKYLEKDNLKFFYQLTQFELIKTELAHNDLAGTAQVEEVQKQTADNFERGKTYRDVNAAIDAFRSATWSILDNYTDSDADKVASIQSEIGELSTLIGTINTTKSVTKQGLIETVKSFFSTNKFEEDEEMTEVS